MRIFQLYKLYLSNLYYDKLLYIQSKRVKLKKLSEKYVGNLQKKLIQFIGITIHFILS